MDPLGALRTFLSRSAARGKRRLSARGFGTGALQGLRWTLAAAAVLAVIGVFSFFASAVDTTRTWRNAAQIAPRDLSAGALFRSLVSHDLIRLNFDRFEILAAPADLPLRAKLRSQPNALQGWPNDLSTDAEAALRGLYAPRANGPGAILRQEIAAWNAAHAVAAVRDDRASAGGVEAAAGPATTPIGVRPLDWKPNVWDVSAQQGPQGAAAPIRDMRQSDLPYDLFGYMGWESTEWPAPDGDWRAAAPLGGTGAATDLQVSFTTRAAPAEVFTVDLVGEAPQVTGARILRRRALCEARAIEKLFPDASTQTLVRRVSFERLPDPDCGLEATQGPVIGHRLLLQVEGSSRGDPSTRVSVRVRPTVRAPNSLRRFAQAKRLSTSLNGDRPDIVTYRGADSIVLRCRRTSAAPECALEWSPRRRPPPGQPPLVGLETADLEPLLTPDAQPTQTAADLGLASLAGLGRDDRFGVGGVLARQSGQGVRAVRLTLRADLQRLAARILTQSVVDQPNRAYLPARHDAARRAALVVLDASDDPTRRGEVLAAAAHPVSPVRDRAAWNLLGADQWRPLSSPLAPRAWGRIDAFATPGSTLKPLVALRLLRAAAEAGADDAVLRQAVSGAADPLNAPGLPPPPGVALLPSGAVETPGRFWAQETHDCAAGRSGAFGWRSRAKICNFVFQGLLEPHDHGFLPPAETGCPTRPGGSPERPQLGLCEATLTSLNSWFIMTALGLDGKDATNRKPLALAEMAAAFPGPGRRNLLGLPAPAAARFRLDPLVLESTRPGLAEPLHVLALNAIGQNAQASPLTVASLYASIAAGCRVAPRLSALADRACPPLFWGDTDDPVEREWERQAQNLMRTHLIPGLAAVVGSSRGTADAAFKDAPYRAFLRGKTGTAEVPVGGGELVNTVWFAGWIEPQGLFNLSADYASLRDRRLAFACMVTHGRGGAASGGRVCAPMIRALFDQLQGLSPAQGAEQ
ncbi:MAG: penicillin-binding transpeptidase domain-containing protein [Pseudomonadota bacterium]